MDIACIKDAVSQINNKVKDQRGYSNGNLKGLLEQEFPELVLKCYEPATLFDLFLIREAVFAGDFKAETIDLLFVGLTNILRQVSMAATGWPYIAPKKLKTSSLNKDALVEFTRQVTRMAQDVELTRGEAHPQHINSVHRIFNNDSRDTKKFILNESVDHVFTSPPYLNNFDYADRTRLELYFFGEAKTWGDITETIRTKLITSATTQISRDDPRYRLSDELQKVSPEVYTFLSQAIEKLSDLRPTKGGKKSYDHLVSGYFNDMFLVLSDVYRVLKPNTKAVFVLGDSAPYGIHIPTDVLIGDIGQAIGFSDYHIDVLRTRGDKWKANPQRHNVGLRESIVTLRKK